MAFTLSYAREHPHVFIYFLRLYQLPRGLETLTPPSSRCGGHRASQLHSSSAHVCTVAVWPPFATLKILTDRNCRRVGWRCVLSACADWLIADVNRSWRNVSLPLTSVRYNWCGECQSCRKTKPTLFAHVNQHGETDHRLCPVPGSTGVYTQTQPLHTNVAITHNRNHYTLTLQLHTTASNTH